MAMIAPLAAARAALARLIRGHRDPVGAFDEYADRFYRATLLMAPGKSTPAAMGVTNREERELAWQKWWEVESEAQIAAAERLLAEHDLLLAERDAYRSQVTGLLARVEAQSGEIYELAREGNRWRALLVRVSEAWAALDENDDLRGHVRHEQVHTAIMVALAAHPQEKP